MQLDQSIIQPFIAQSLKEDIGDGDHTSLSTIPVGKQGEAQLIVKDEGVLAGITVALAIFKAVNPGLKVEVLLEDGTKVRNGDIALYVTGSVHSILVAERLVLNTMQRMSGIASTTNRVVKLLSETGTQVLDTRKTTPGMRYLEKLAVKIGGGVNHRFGLYDMILIKDNHVDYAGGIEKAILASQKYLKEKKIEIPIEIEVRNLTEVREVLAVGGVNRILLDNFNLDHLKEAVKLIDGRYKTEASGGIIEENVIDYAHCGVDFISMGALTHSFKSLDMSLKALKA